MYKFYLCSAASITVCDLADRVLSSILDADCAATVQKHLEANGIQFMFFDLMKDMFYKNTATKLAALVVKKGLRQIRDTFDASAYGAAPIIGLAKPVFKAHGNADASTIASAVRQAVRYVEGGAAKAMAELAFIHIKTEQ